MTVAQLSEMSMNDCIDLEELKNAINVLFNHLREGGITKVQLKKEYYWEIAVEQLYNMEAKPAEIDIGSLFYDRDDVHNLATGKRLPVVPLLLKIAPLLNYIAHDVSEMQLLSKPAREET